MFNVNELWCYLSWNAADHDHLAWLQKTESVDGNFSMDDLYQTGGPDQLEEAGYDVTCIGLLSEDEDHIRKINEFQAYLDMVMRMVKPGCSPEVLNVALNSMSSLADILAFMSSLKLHSSL
ncbi:hypothetical protein SLEP1_g43368 [Rubroshorea leprosula]|uniref:Uncharacterized protein n=1 Tax=Rubroshorea leprosula TaxID=152421 RepID=A0AAV5LDQ6_9ROSI|nr:hypothetical protein SLEP1_g43368 [Rubroshorea leprosula]